MSYKYFSVFEYIWFFPNFPHLACLNFTISVSLFLFVLINLTIQSHPSNCCELSHLVFKTRIKSMPKVLQLKISTTLQSFWLEKKL